MGDIEHKGMHSADPIPVTKASTVTSEEEDADTVKTTTATSTAPKGFGFCDIINNGATMVWAAFGSAPTAAVGTTSVVMAGERRTFAVEPSDKASVIIDS